MTWLQCSYQLLLQLGISLLVLILNRLKTLGKKKVAFLMPAFFNIILMLHEENDALFFLHTEEVQRKVQSLWP